MKMAAGSENESDDAVENGSSLIVTRTPALSTAEESFVSVSGNGIETKKPKLSPSKTKTSNPANNSKSASPTKSKKSAQVATSITSSKSKGTSTTIKK